MFSRKRSGTPRCQLVLAAGAALFVLAGLGSSVVSPPQAAAQAAFSFPRNPATPTEVVIIGTRHSAQLEYEDHAPARMRALLNRIDPAAVGVETLPAWFEEGVYYEIAYESYGVGVAWAREKGREVRGIDWQANSLEMMNALAWPDTGAVGSVQWEPGRSGGSRAGDPEPGRAGGNGSDRGVEPGVDRAGGGASDPGGGPAGDPAGEPDSVAQVDSLELWDMREMLFADTPEWRDELNLAWGFAKPLANPLGEAMRRYMLYRNLRIAREIVNLAADYDGQRIAVLIGAAHKPDLDLFLGTVPNIVVRNASEWWGDGLTAEEVEAEERRADHLAILWYNLAGGRVPPEEVDLARMDALLARVEAGPWDPEVEFLRARRHAVAGAAEKAVEIYRTLAWERDWKDRPFTYPDLQLSQRVLEWYVREAEALGYGTGTELYPFEAELGLDNVISPVGNLTVRQRILYELAVQEVDGAARQRARAELENAGLNPTQAAQLRALLDGE